MEGLPRNDTCILLSVGSMSTEKAGLLPVPGSKDGRNERKGRRSRRKEDRRRRKKSIRENEAELARVKGRFCAKHSRNNKDLANLRGPTHGYGRQEHFCKRSSLDFSAFNNYFFDAVIFSTNLR